VNVVGVTVVNTLPEEEWRRFVEEHPAGNIFHTPEMFQVFERTKGYQPKLWAAVDDNNQPLVLLAPVQITLVNGPILRQFTTRAVAYGSVLCIPTSSGKEALKILLQTYQREVKANVLFTELRNQSDLRELQSALNKSGFVYEEHLNFLIDLRRPVEEIWRSVHSNVRTNVRKAHQKGVVIEEIASLDKIPVVYKILSNVYDRIQVPLAPFSLFEAAFDILYGRNMIKCYLARVEDNYIAAAVRLLYKNVIYAWYVGVVEEYTSYKANDLLNWHVLEWGAQNNFNCFDFGGAGKPDEDYGPRKFKAKFGGTLVSHGRNICVHTPLRLRFSRAGYRIMRRFLR
jgi:lipid II:glycine glycyltransferase (peptidoglycan interpeptide bridge formation enzyme)